ncbi:MAG: acetyl-CoA acetyltransferase [Planctomycetes bacterium]|nr:acetyl-CoA acetyltransferase [Planctomycetota bacterium]
MGVAVMGVGICGAFSASNGLSYRELIARAATMAYQDAGIKPDDIDGAVSVDEDFASGYSIADEYSPDQLGMALKPVYTVCGDFLQGIGSACMQIQTGQFRTLVVAAYSKASNILLKDELIHFAFDPVFHRLGVSPSYLAAIEMQHFLGSSFYSLGDVAEVVTSNRSRAIGNPLAPYGGTLRLEDVLGGRPVATPVTAAMIARHADAAVVVVLGTDKIALEKARRPVFVRSTGWASAHSILERRDHACSEGTALAARSAYAEAGIRNAAEEIGVFYVSDTYAHRQLMHMEALGLTEETLPRVNPDGGALGGGDLFDATAGMRLCDAVQQLRGEAGAHQIAGVTRALVHGWRGLPTDTCAVAILDAERRSA